MAALVWVVIALAFAGGLAEVAIAVVRRSQGGINLLDPRGAWSTPLGNLVFFAVVALGALALRFVARGPLVRLLTLAAITALAVFAPLAIAVPRVHPIALVMLSLGVGVVFARWAAERPRALHRWSRRVALALCAVSAAATILMSRRQAAPAPEATVAALPPETPNVLLLILDTVRADALSAYGYARSTSPFLESMASRGVRFTHAVATSPWTLPTHASILTGQYPHHTSASWTTGLDGTHRTLAEILASQGFRTGGFVANREYASSAVGLHRGFQSFRDVGRGPRHLMATSSLWWWLTRSYNRLRNRNVLLNRRSAAEVNDDFLRWLDERPQAPFFAFLNYFDAHSPYTPPRPYDMKFADREPETRELPFGGIPPTPEVTQQLRDAYDGGIAYIDAQIAQLWTELERRGVAGRTTIIITSDHGEEFLEHGAVGHGSSLYWASVHVPLIVVHERCVPAATVTRTVSLRDLPQTILDLTGITSSEIPGHSLTRLWSDTSFQGELSPVVQAVDTAANNTFDYPIAKGNMRAINGDAMRLIVNGDSSLELYRIRDDPLERAALSDRGADSTAARALLTTLRGVLALPTPPSAGQRITAGRSRSPCAVTP